MEIKLIKRCLTEKEAAHYIGMSASYLKKDRMEGRIGGRTPGPKYLKIGKSIRYLKEDLDQWLETKCLNSK
jgi:predicted DNA-binding transcriptional regulator AlpA